MINRGFIYILATLIVGLTSFRAFAEDTPEFDPEKFARIFMAAVGYIQAETSIQELKEYKNTYLVDVDARMAEILLEKKTAVESIRNKLKDLDDAIQTCHIRLVIAMGTGNTAEQEALLKTLETRREQLVSEKKIAYKAYANYRGRVVVHKIIFKVLVKEIDKRLAQLGNNTATGNLGNNTATGTWSVVHIKSGESESTRTGDFWLTIATNGVISGTFHEVGVGEFIVWGKWSPADGGCDGKINDNLYPATWKGNLKKGPGGYTGSGTLEYKTFEATSRDGRWATR